MKAFDVRHDAHLGDGGRHFPSVTGVLAPVNLHPDPARVATNLTAAAKGQMLTAVAMDTHHSFQQALAPFSAKPGPQGLVLELLPNSVVVVGM